MGRADYLKEGDWNRICDRCGFKYKASDTAKEWQGLITCPQCWEPRQPQDHVRGRRDRQKPAWTRPEKAANFVSTVRYVDEDDDFYVDDAGNYYTDGNTG